MSDLHGYSGSWSNWKLADVAPAKQIDGGNPNSFSHVVARHDRSDDTGSVYQIAYAQLHNRSGGAAHVGLGVRLPLTAWKAGQWVDATTTYTDDTTDAQDVGANDFALETTTANDGFAVQAQQLFNALEIDIGTSSSGTGPVRVLEYSLAGGTWGSITNFILFAGSGAHYAAGTNHVIWWIPPADWAVLEAGHGTGFTTGLYGMRVRATTPPGTAAGLADSMSVHRIYWSHEGLADNAEFEIPLGGMYAPLERAGNALVAAFSVANVQNRATVLYRTRG